jgi:hypothetical protein
MGFNAETPGRRICVQVKSDGTERVPICRGAGAGRLGSLY